MYISAREKRILDMLLDGQNNLVTVKSIAETLEVSSRTIYRDLEGMESLLKQFHLSLYTEPGKGIQIQGSAEEKETLKSTVEDIDDYEITTIERRILILGELLEASFPIKLISFANDFGVTMATISKDLTEMEDWVRAFHLNLVRKQNYGIQIMGSEQDKRQAMSALVKQYFDESKFITMLRQNLQKSSDWHVDTVSKRLLEMISKDKIKLIEQIVGEVICDLPYSIADSSYIGLVVHLALTMERIKQGKTIDIDSDYLNEMKMTPEYETAQRIAMQLNADMPEEEVGYITIHLRGAKLRYDDGSFFEEPNIDLAAKVTTLIKHIDYKLNTRLIDDRFLFQGLMAHLERSIYRIQQQLGINNPLLDQIRSNYRSLFEMIKQSADDIFVPLIIEEAEIGFLTLHFGSALERQYESRLKAAIVCSSGIGSSKMLASRIESEIAEIKYIDNISLFELSYLDIDDYDLILSTIPLPLDEEDYIIISPLLTEKEVFDIRNLIQYKRKDFWKSGSVKASEKQLLDFNKSIHPTISKLERIKQMSTMIVTLLENHHFAQLNNSKTVKDALFQAISLLKTKGIISDVSTVVNNLMNRQQISGLGIPETSLALYHCRSDAVLTPSSSIFSLESPLTIPAMDGSEIRAKTFLIQLAPLEPDNVTLELLQYISSLLVEEKESILIFESENASWIRSYLVDQLTKYFFNNMENGK
ncbi:BglG family transcription antiterminator [Oceanobacillus timonensis]|uniref:BglG family transcription antiterminator n=1 Tax=Oceanobacillus timonensis TaxID=1926285 RepID=UPI0009BB4613|nr:PRD domain-containing protein [Oceanobacillus timonensis]